MPWRLRSWKPSPRANSKLSRCIKQAGIRAAHGVFTLKLLGYENASNYGASFAEWANDERYPLER